MYTIKNANILNDEFKFEKNDLQIDNGKIVKIGSDLSGGELIDAKGAYIFPGLVNIHTHGAMGYDSVGCGYEGINEMSKLWAKTGTTSFLPTLVTALRDDLCKAAENVASVMDKGTDGATVIGIHLEGPYLSEKYKGAHRPDWLRTPKEFDFDEVQAAAQGNIRLLTMAPELDGGIKFIKKYADKVKISLGHTAATYDVCKEAFEAGAAHVTHLFNAMPGIHHRDLTLIAAAFESDAMIELIGDGLHVKKQPAMMAYKLFGDERMILINDSVNAAGLGDGKYEFGGFNVTVKDGIALQDNGTICGGTATLWDCVMNMISWGVSIQSAVKMATYNPAKAIGLADKIGSIKEGKDADILIVSSELQLCDVFVKGRKI